MNKTLMLAAGAASIAAGEPLMTGRRSRPEGPRPDSPLLRRRTSGVGAEHGWKGDGVQPRVTRQMRRELERLARKAAR